MFLLESLRETHRICGGCQKAAQMEEQNRFSATISELSPPFGVYLSAVKDVEVLLTSSSGLFSAVLQEY